MCVAQPENSDEPIYTSCMDIEQVARLTQEHLQPKPKPEVALETDPDDHEDEASLYFNRKR